MRKQELLHKKENIKKIFDNYLSNHSLLVIGKDRKVKIKIDDKRALIYTIKEVGKIIGKKISSKKYTGIKGKIANIGIDIVGNRFMGDIEKELQKMNYKDCMDIIYGYVGGIIKIVLERTGGNMTNGECLGYFLNYFQIDKNENKNKKFSANENNQVKKNSSIIKEVLMYNNKYNEDMKRDTYYGFDYRKK